MVLNSSIHNFHCTSIVASDHLINVEASELFEELVGCLPLHAGANIIQADSLTTDWFEPFSKKIMSSI